MSLEIPKLNFAVHHISELKTVFKALPKISLACFSWDAPYSKPEVGFKMAHNNEAIFVCYQVCEDEMLARYSQHNQPVYTDSCVEFFIAFNEDSNYYNFEFNSLGTCLAAWGPDRNQRQSTAPDLLDQIRTRTTVSRLNQGQSPRFEWQICIQLPVSVFIHNKITKLSETKARANFYKCGDDLSEPHFVSWKKIETNTPDFHQPSFFGELSFL
ncbi:carbohydrate-binding family 9-like protein [uncultured Sunxiuqinia sp.]|uniref:carbohydrate-binding family 9-like protein n=1 Tax=uncultured Sunxiuqinia sp. TaxID=1573825 RepID=UPI002AA5F900|nr:carbohydrate-binding family 9-like protein [uncultured Sunxiuqinia sp.]